MQRSKNIHGINFFNEDIFNFEPFLKQSYFIKKGNNYNKIEKVEKYPVTHVSYLMNKNKLINRNENKHENKILVIVLFFRTESYSGI